MKAVISIVFCLVLAISTRTADAQNFYDNQYYAFQNQLQQHDRMMDQWVAGQMNQIQQDYQRQMQLAIQRYRQETGDYQSPDHVCLERAWAKWHRENPEAARQWQQMSQRHHQERMGQIQQYGQTSQMMHHNSNEILDMQMGSHQRRSNWSDQSQHNLVNGIHERGDYRNPHTGQVYNLPWSQPNAYHQGPYGNQFYTGPNHGQYQYNGYGYQPLDEIR